ncbi:LAQU0S02e06986g1_1 [Lachancea quebecensis]|uniref:LAQU0S02e06986g1_1 n=1 Tax=Lachancea quebecensis TaxID=1654605 RepID=A0A0P1KPH0_9SACH|nr:LAQU0S02e06986g1_1 [Lachancea quebecensis]
MISRKVSIKQIPTICRIFESKSTIKTTTFPTFAARASYGSYTVANRSKTSGGQKPTVVISSDNDEIETVGGHVRV